MIGLLPTMYRLWGEIRINVTRAWARENHRDFLYAGEKAGSVDAVEHQMFNDDAARLRNERSAAIMQGPPECASAAPMCDNVDGSGGEAGGGDLATIPLHYFSRDRSVAWEYPGPGGVGTSYAQLIGVSKAREDCSEDEW